jgi:hypothetical protein
MMKTCPYCGKPCVPTREHVIPDWFTKSVGTEGVETFNARSPMRQVAGDVVINDVCRGYNNGVLSDLDRFGKDLFDSTLKHPVFAGQTITFATSRSLLLRWLLKLCYNSARVHNADCDLLAGFVPVILGQKMASPIEMRVFASLVCPSDLSAQPPRAARPDQATSEHIWLPEWFRVTQLRFPKGLPCPNVVRRQVMINSFVFTLVAHDRRRPVASDETAHFIQQLRTCFPGCAEIVDDGAVGLTTGWLHALVLAGQLWNQHPIRYRGVASELDELLNALATGKGTVVCVAITRGEIESASVAATVAILNGLVRDREAVMASSQRIRLIITGYNDEPRALWEVKEVRAYLGRLFEQCPYLFLLLSPEPAGLGLLLACMCAGKRKIVIGTVGEFELDGSDLARWLTEGFAGLNAVCERYAISEEENRRMCGRIQELLNGMSMPP